MIPAIVLSTHNMGLGVIRSLGEKGVPIIAIVYTPNDMGYLSKYVKESIYAPHPEKHPLEFIKLLTSCHIRYGKCLIIPADDATLWVVSKYKSLLEKNHLVACCGWEVTHKVLDKKHTYAVAEAVGVEIPQTRTPKSSEEVKEFCDLIGFPCLVKPCYSHRYFELFRKKLTKVNTLGEALHEYKTAKKAGIEVMIQEYIPGEDSNGANYNSYFLEGQPVAEITAQKVRLSPKGFGVPCVVSSKHIEEISQPGRELLRALGFHGYSCIEFKEDSRNGKYKLMEVNGRYNRSILLSNKCGINFPWLEYQYFVLGKIDPIPEWREGVFWIDEFRDIYEQFKPQNKGNFQFKKLMTPYFGKRSFAVFDLKDLKPFFKRAMDARWVGGDYNKKEYLLQKALINRFFPKPKANDVQ